MKGKPSKRSDAYGPTAPQVRVLKSAQCPSLSGRSQLTYQLGSTPDSEIHLRIHANSGRGCFGKDWVALRTLQQALAKATPPITSGTLHRVFEGRSQNTGGFVLAALFHEGLLRPLAGARGYAPTDGVEFMRQMKRLMDGGKAQAAARAPAKTADAPTPAQKAAAKPKAGAAMPPEKKSRAPSKAKARRK